MKNNYSQLSDSMRLQIGTTKLTYIARGYVKLGRVPKLCYSDSVDWSRIGKNTVAVYQKNRKDCPPCPNDCNGKWNATLSRMDRN